MKDDLIFIQHIRDSINNIYEFIGDSNFDDFSKNKMMLSGVVREFEIIGEASNKISKNFQENHPEIPWINMIEMRNFLIHEYFGVIPESIWKTYKEDLLMLRENIEEILTSQ